MKINEKLRIQRKISRELQLESGIKHRPVVHQNKKKYNRKKLKNLLKEFA